MIKPSIEEIYHNYNAHAKGLSQIVPGARTAS